MGATVVAKVKTGVITSEPLGKLRTDKARRLAEDPEFTITPYFLLKRRAILRSNSLTALPGAILVGLLKTSLTARISGLPKTAKAVGTRSFVCVFFICVVMFIYYSNI